MNMASRIETTGKKDKIHLSRDTALLLRPQFVVKREDTVTLKGKGEQETYWFAFHSRSSEGSHSSDRDSYFNSNTTESGPEPDALTEIGAWTGTTLSDILGKTMIDPTTERLVLWNVDTLKPMLCAIIAKREATAMSQSPEYDVANVERDAVQHEVQVVIEMEKFDAEVAARTTLSDKPLPQEVETELLAYVSAIASGYPKNPCKCAKSSRSSILLYCSNPH
jgi:Adenylate and Guanylate cyclase catalytic domain